MITVTSREQIADAQWHRHPAVNSYWRRRMLEVWDEWQPERLTVGPVARRPGPREVIYLPATRGTWGRGARVRVGRSLLVARREREQQAEAARREQTLAPYRAVLAASGLNECFRVGAEAHAVYVYEYLHDCGGSFGDRVDSPEALRAYLERHADGHHAVYHARRSAAGPA